MPPRSLAVLAAVGLTVLLGACRTTPPEGPAEAGLEVPARFTAAPAGGEALGAQATGWADAMGDPRLPVLLEQAVRGNRDLRVAAARVEASRARAALAGADRLPTLNAGFGASRSQAPEASFFGQNTNYEADLTLSWEIDLWGRLRDLHTASGLDYAASAAEFYGAYLSLAATTARAWFDLQEATAQYELGVREADSFARTAELIERRFEEGISPALDLRLARNNAASALRQREQRARVRDAAARQLEILLGAYPAAAIEATGELPRLEDTVPPGLPAELLARRPDIVAAQRRLFAGFLRVDAARKQWLPQISLSASGGVENNDLDELPTDANSIYRLFAGVTQPIFQGGRIAQGVELSRAEREAAVQDYAQVVLEAFGEVERALAAATFLRAEEAALLVAVEEASAAEELALERYDRGLVDIITVLESQRRSYSAQSQLLAVKNARLQNRIGLYVALGGDFSTEPLFVLEPVEALEDYPGRAPVRRARPTK